MRAAIYARMSTDKQSADSPADQIARCREFAARRGLQVVDALVMVDAGISGASRHDRPGLLTIMEKISEWDVLLCFDSSRLARDEEDFGWILNTLDEHGRTGFEASTGQELSAFGTRIMDVVNAEERRKIKVNTRRGLQGRVERGLSAGGVPYGYRNERIGEEGQGSKIVVVPAEAEVVRRIFTTFAAGPGLKAIAHELNAEAVQPPRPRTQRGQRPSWAPSAIREMLRNPIYRGERIWNRSEWRKLRRGPRRRLARPEAEWLREHREEWRIVPEELWEAVQARIASRAPDARKVRPPTEAGPRPKHLLAGFLVCGECGSSFHVAGGGRKYACSGRTHRGAATCRNTVRVRAADLEARVVEAIQAQILSPAIAMATVETALEVLRDERDTGEVGRLRERLAAIGPEITRLVDLAARVGDNLDEIAGRIRALKVERTALESRVRELELEVLDVEALRPRIEARLADLGRHLAEDGRDALRALFRGERLRVGPDPERGYRVDGRAWLRLPSGDGNARGSQAPGRSLGVVAGG